MDWNQNKQTKKQTNKQQQKESILSEKEMVL